MDRRGSRRAFGSAGAIGRREQPTAPPAAPPDETAIGRKAVRRGQTRLQRRPDGGRGRGPDRRGGPGEDRLPSPRRAAPRLPGRRGAAPLLRRRPPGLSGLSRGRPGRLRRNLVNDRTPATPGMAVTQRVADEGNPLGGGAPSRRRRRHGVVIVRWARVRTPIRRWRRAAGRARGRSSTWRPTRWHRFRRPTARPVPRGPARGRRRPRTAGTRASRPGGP